MKKPKKGLLVVIGILCLVLVGGGLAYAAEKDKQEKIADGENKIERETRKLSEDGEIYRQVQALFDSKKESYLKVDLTEDAISSVEEKVDSSIQSAEKVFKDYPDLRKQPYKKAKKSLQDRLEEAKQKLQVQTSVNELFSGEEKVINGTNVELDLSIKEDLTTEKVTQQVSELEDTPDSEWKASIKEILAQVSVQIEWNQKAKDAVDALFDGETVKGGLTEETYAAAKTVVDQVKNETIKKRLSDKLVTVRKKMDEEKARMEAESKAAAEAEAQANGGTVTQNEDGTYHVEQPQAGQSSGYSGNPYSQPNDAGNPSSSGNSGHHPSGGGNSSSGSTNTNPGGSSSSNGSSGNSWNTDATEGGTISGGATEGGGNTWTGGEFDPGINW